MPRPRPPWNESEALSWIDSTRSRIAAGSGAAAPTPGLDRETDGRAAVFSQRLTGDLRAEAWGYEMQIGYFGTVLANARQAADALSGTSSLSDEALLVAAYRGTQYNGNIRRRSTYDELTRSGKSA